MRTIIIDDDTDSHNVLRKLLARNHPEIDFQGSAFSISEGVNLIGQSSPELVFLDIELPDGFGFDILTKIEAPQFQVIFITAFNKYATTAFKFGAIDFLEKPIPRKALKEAIGKVKNFEGTKISYEHLQLVYQSYEELSSQKLPDRITLSSQKEIFFPKIEHIIHLKAVEAYTIFHIDGYSTEIISSYNLGKYLDLLAPYPFLMQVQRSHMINLNYVQRYDRGERQIIMTDGSKINIARGYLDNFLERMKS